MGRFADKVAVITGASKGIGVGIAKRLAAEGATVVVNYVSSKDGANHIVDDIVRAGGKALAIGASVTNEDEVTRLFEDVRKAFGRVDAAGSPAVAARWWRHRDVMASSQRLPQIYPLEKRRQPPYFGHVLDAHRTITAGTSRGRPRPELPLVRPTWPPGNQNTSPSQHE